MADEAMADLVGRKLGDFVLREQIGEGGYAVVYRCEQQQLGRDVVVKVLHERRRYTDAALDRFQREARLASQLDHPYAAHIYAFGDEDDGVLWIAMELVHGVPLGDWLEAHGPMPLAQFVPFFECVADVVHAAHARGIVHRDLKPSNVMVIEHDGRLFPKLLDFGIAKLTRDAAPPALERPSGVDAATASQRTRTDPEAAARGHRLTRSDARLGSRAYMSPEQWADPQAVGPAADIYALGILAYEALTGRRPFTADNTHEYYRQHVYAEVPPLGGGLSPDFDRVIQRALAKQPEKRHRSALELASELRSVLRAQPREQLRTSAQQWEDQDRPQGLLWGPDVLANIAQRVPLETLGELECSFVAASLRRARRLQWLRRALLVLAIGIVPGGLLYRTVMQARADRQVAEATIRQSELEQGRSALLHGERDAPIHLGRAYKLGDHSPSTAFMLARALQPRLAEQARFTSSFGSMWSAAFSPDGRRIVTTDDRTAQVRDAQTGSLLFTLPYGATVYQAAYSTDGTRIVAAGGGSVKIWDASSGALIRELKRYGATPRYYTAAISPDGKLVAAIDTEGDIANVWDAVTGDAVAEIRNEASEFPAIAFSADGRWLATTGGNDVRVFDAWARTQAVIIRGPGIRGLAFDPTGPRLLTGAVTGDVAIWSVPTGARIQHLRDVRDPVEAVAYSSDGQLAAAGSREGAEQVWHAASGELQSQLNPRHSKILAVEFDRASRLVLAAGADGSVVVADAALGVPVAVLEGPQNAVLVAHFDPSARRVVGASVDGTAWVWNTTSPYARWRSPPVSDDCGIVTTAEPDRRFIAVGCDDRATHVWDTARDQLLAELPSVSRVEGDFTSAFPAVSSAGDRAAIARGNTVEVYKLPGGRLLRTIAHAAAVNTVAFATTGRDLVSGAIDGSLLVTREGGAQIILPTSPGGIDTASFLPDGRVVAADAQHRLRIYDPGGTLLTEIELPERVMSLRTDRTRLVTVPMVPRYTGSAATPLLIDCERYRLIAQLDGHVGRVFSARWVAEGQILTAGADGTARLWDGATGQLRRVYKGGSRPLADATLLSENQVMGGGADGVLRLWDRDSGRPLWTLHAHASQIIGVHVEGDDIVTRGFTGELARWTLPSPAQVIKACNDGERCATLLK